MQPEPISSIIRRILSKSGLDKEIKKSEIFGQWPEIVGKKIASKAELVAIEQGILFVQVSDSSWRNELSLMEGIIIAKINETFDEERVSRIYLL
ncbi:DUF721 domain-containing protein [bacterium]|nr:DUF721 domain-containing protein [bacterium]